MENKKILAKLAAVASDVGYIQKDSKNEHQKYRYASEKVIKEHLHEAFVKHGVVMQINVGTPIPSGVVVYLPVEYVFWDVESGETLSGNFIGAGHTRDDKGIYAAVTGAIKYILTSTFLIPTGDDPEKDDPKDKEPDKTPVRVSGAPTMASGTVTQKQWALIETLRKEHGVPDQVLADLTEWASGNPTQEQASEWINGLMGHPKRSKFNREKTLVWIEEHEKKVYPMVARMKARQKYLGTELLKDATDDQLRAYATHIKERDVK